MLFNSFWTGWRRWAAWSICLAVILVLGLIRKATDAEFAFASLALVPVLFTAWISGKWGGLLTAALAAGMWAVGDIASDRQFEALWIPWANAITRLVTYSLVALLAAKVRFHFEQEHECATRDALTGVLNRRAFLDAGISELERSERYSHSLAVIFLDLDNFKQLNDTKGHEAGDAALQATAQALVRALRIGDRVARLGGDEFAVLLPEIGYDEAVEAGSKLSLVVIGALRNFPPVTGSIGVAWFGEVDRTFPEMLRAADELMYEVKEQGKANMRSRRFPCPK